MVSLQSFEVAGMKGAVQLPPLFTRGTLRFEGTGIAGGGVCPVFTFSALCSVRNVVNSPKG